MKIFAFYLPQFHCIPENDKWWGKGFTEWTNLKAARPLFKGHTIIHPYNDNYYNLLNRTTIEWQTNTMTDYGIDGLIYYHYYFKGKHLLEKPEENLLKWKDINQKFFFCWANHSWRRTWEGKQEILMPMEYGDKDDWEKHFEYLLPFFKDLRYEKKNNKPLFMLFKYDFKEKNEMLQFFDLRAKQEGFDGICIIETDMGIDSDDFQNKKSPLTEYTYLRDPGREVNDIRKKNKRIDRRILWKISRLIKYNDIAVFDGEKILIKKIENLNKQSDIIHGLLFEWDNTSRHKNKGYIITPFSYETFIEYMNKIQDEEYLFINAWNEWCEGMVLEPTKEKGYKYLEWIQDWKSKKK